MRYRTLLLNFALLAVATAVILLSYDLSQYMLTEMRSDVTYVRAPAESPVYHRISYPTRAKYQPLVRLVNLAQGLTFCSGTVLSKDYVLTAAHCLVQESFFGSRLTTAVFAIVGETPSGIKSPGVHSVAIAFDTAADYALVRGDYHEFSAAVIADAPHLFFQVRGPLLACGYPYQSSAVCYGLGTEGSTYYHQVSIGGRLFPGMSGGPVVDVGNDRIIAVNSANAIGSVIIAPVTGIFDNLGITVSDK